MNWFYSIGILVICYLVGAIPFGYLIGRLKGVDVRNVGSCNVGATNVSRCVGLWYGRACFGLDFAKGLLPVIILAGLFPQGTSLEYLPLAGGACAIAGHMFSVFLKFKGGKGISTAAGVIVALSPYALLLALLIWIAVFMAYRYVSLASIIAVAIMPLAATGWFFTEWSPRTLGGELVFFYIIAILAIFKHRSNISRLLAGTENRFERKK